MKKFILGLVILSFLGSINTVSADIYQDVAKQDGIYNICLKRLNMTLEEFPNFTVAGIGSPKTYTPEEKLIAYNKQKSGLAVSCPLQKAELDRLKSFLPAGSFLKSQEASPLITSKNAPSSEKVEELSPLQSEVYILKQDSQDQNINNLQTEVWHLQLAFIILSVILIGDLLLALFIFRVFKK